MLFVFQEEDRPFCISILGTLRTSRRQRQQERRQTTGFSEGPISKVFWEREPLQLIFRISIWNLKALVAHSAGESLHRQAHCPLRNSEVKYIII